MVRIDSITKNILTVDNQPNQKRIFISPKLLMGRWFVVFFVLFLAFSCKKEVTISKKEIISAKYWQIHSAIIQPSAQVLNGYWLDDLFLGMHKEGYANIPVIPACDKYVVYHFKSNDSLLLTIPNTCKSSGLIQEGKWLLDKNEAYLFISSGATTDTLELKVVESDRLYLEKKYILRGISHILLLEMKAAIE